MSRYERNRELGALMQEVIEQNAELVHLETAGLEIGCQYSDQTKRSHGNRTYADTMIVPEKLKEFLDVDFVITFYRPNCERLDDEHMARLMYHELRHVGYDDGRLFIVPHDLEDFRDCVERWGIDWIANRVEKPETEKQE